MPQTSVILDVVIGAVMAIFLLLGMKKGFFRTLADLVLVFIAAFGANLAAKSLAGPAAKLLAPMLEQQVLTRLEAAMGDLAGLAEGVVSAASEELVHTISFGILFLLAFLVLVIVLKILVGATDLVLHLPVLRQCNELGGAVLGLLLGCLVAWIAVRIALAFGWWVTQEMADGSILLGLLKRIPIILQDL